MLGPVTSLGPAALLEPAIASACDISIAVAIDIVADINQLESILAVPPLHKQTTSLKLNKVSHMRRDWLVSLIPYSIHRNESSSCHAWLDAEFPIQGGLSSSSNECGVGVIVVVPHGNTYSATGREIEPTSSGYEFD